MDPPAPSSANAAPVTTVSQSPPLLVKKLSPTAKTPTRGSAFAAGYDIYASQASCVPKRGKVLVDTDIAIAVPQGTCELAPFLYDLWPSVVASKTLYADRISIEDKTVE